jgi:Zn-dependent alcohol dehydrogenase
MMEAAPTYRVVQAVSRGRLELTEKTLQAPGPGKVRIRVEACGVCVRIKSLDPREPTHDPVHKGYALAS